jgi:biotin operon repressor
MTQRNKPMPQDRKDALIAILRQHERDKAPVDMPALCAEFGAKQTLIKNVAHLNGIRLRTKETLYVRIRQAASPDKTVSQLAEELGVSRGALYKRIGHMRDHGEEVPFKIVSHKEKATVSISILKQLQPEVRAWLKSQTPKGSTLSDMIRAIIVDAYHEENDKC